jgi:protein phosphatase
MHFITSALGQHAGLVHAVAGVIIVMALLFFLLETASAARKRRVSRMPATLPLSLPRPITPSAGQAPSGDAADQDSCPQLPQVCLFCQDDVEPDEATFPYARILVSARGDSDAGRKRAQNEDSLLLLPEHSLFAVADGMGGYYGGKVASTLAVDTIKLAFDQTSFEDELQSDLPIPRLGRELANALVQANRAVFDAARAEPKLAEMGTTLVAARFSANKRRVYVGHVGDSRCYRFRRSRLTQLTTDHTMRHLGLEGPRANELFRAVGIEESVVVDLVIDIPRPEDIYLLCSDGLPKMVSNERIEEALRAESDLEAAVYRLIELANDAGGRDNVTVILVRVRERLALEADLSTDKARQNCAPDHASRSQRVTVKTHAPNGGAQ